MTSTGERLEDLLAMGPRGRPAPALSASGGEDLPATSSSALTEQPGPDARPRISIAALQPEAVPEQDDPGIAKLRSAYDKAEAALASPLPELPSPGPRPQYRDYRTPVDYDAGLIEWAALEAGQKAAVEVERKQREAAAAAAFDALSAAQLARGRAAFGDFDETVLADDLPVTLPMADAILKHAQGPEIAYHLGKNPEQAAQISRLGPTAQILELGRLAGRLAPVPKPRPSAPKARGELSMEQYAAKRAPELKAAVRPWHGEARKRG